LTGSALEGQGVLALERSIASIGAMYPMKFRKRPSVDACSANSDFDEKLVTI